MSTKKAYKQSIGIYDGILTQKSLLGKLYMNLLWSGVDDNEIANTMLKFIPDDFSGSILDVPVGTAVFTQTKWGSLSNANITCLDYSQDMLLQARAKLADYSHITYVQGDVGNLQFGDEHFDIVISMNGFHAFPNQYKAYDEIFRVLKKGGMFTACFYIKGQKKHTDIWVDKFLAKKGWFSKPFQTIDDVKTQLESKYENVQIEVNGAMVYFKCIKGE